MRKKILAEFKEIFTQLNEYQRLAFGIAVAERMLPTYKAFSEINQFGKVEILENAIFLLKNNNLPQNITQLLADIEQNAPDTEDFSGNLLATAALDTVAVLYELLLMHSDQEITRLQTICSLALNAPYMCMHASISNPYEEAHLQAEIYLFKQWISQILANKNPEIPKNDWVEKMALLD